MDTLVDGKEVLKREREIDEFSRRVGKVIGLTHEKDPDIAFYCRACGDRFPTPHATLRHCVEHGIEIWPL